MIVDYGLEMMTKIYKPGTYYLTPDMLGGEDDKIVIKAH